MAVFSLPRHSPAAVVPLCGAGPPQGGTDEES